MPTTCLWTGWLTRPGSEDYKVSSPPRAGLLREFRQFLDRQVGISRDSSVRCWGSKRIGFLDGLANAASQRLKDDASSPNGCCTLTRG
jgi:hypothetical protein